MANTRRRELLKLGVVAGLGISGIPMNNVASADSKVGDLLWKDNRGRSPGYTSPTIINDTVYVGHRSGTDTGHLYSLDADTGDRNWVFTSYEMKSAPTVVDGSVYITDGDLIAVEASSGNKEWEFSTENHQSSSPTVSDGTVFVGSSVVHAVDAAKGDELWQFKTEGVGTTAATVNDGTVYIGGYYPHRIYAINASSGEEEWHFNADDDVTAPTVANGTVYIGSNDGHVYALDAQDGTETWQFEPEGKKREGETGEYISDGVNTIPTVADGVVYIGSNDGHVYALDAQDGTEKWRFKTEGYKKSTDIGSYFADAVKSSPTVAGDTVFAGCQDNYIYALDVSDGEQKWRYDTGDNKLSAPTVVDGVVFVGSRMQENGGNLYAIDAGVDGSSEGSRVLQRTIGHHHGRVNGSQQSDNEISDEPEIQNSDVTIEFTNNFRTESTTDFLDSLYNEVQQALPTSNPTVPDKNEAYIDVDMRIRFNERLHGSIAEVRPVLTGDHTEETFTVSNYENFFDDAEYDDDYSISKIDSGVFGVDNFQIRHPTQVGLKVIETVLTIAGALSAGEITSPIEAKTESYPDVYVTGLEIEDTAGEKTVLDVQKRLPRYDDVCGSVGLSSLLSSNCEYGGNANQYEAGAMVFSPATVAIQDEQGRITGQVWEDGKYKTYNQIPNALYSGQLRHEFVVFPDGEYEILVDGKENGEVTIQVDRVQENIVQTDVYADLTVDGSSRLKRSLDTKQLSVDSNRDGTTDGEIEPDRSSEMAPANLLEARLDSRDDVQSSNKSTGRSDSRLPWIPIAGGAGTLGAAGYLYKKLGSDDRQA